MSVSVHEALGFVPSATKKKGKEEREEKGNGVVMVAPHLRTISAF